MFLLCHLVSPDLQLVTPPSVLLSRDLDQIGDSSSPGWCWTVQDQRQRRPRSWCFISPQNISLVGLWRVKLLSNKLQVISDVFTKEHQLPPCCPVMDSRLQDQGLVTHVKSPGSSDSFKPTADTPSFSFTSSIGCHLPGRENHRTKPSPSVDCLDKLDSRFDKSWL